MVTLTVGARAKEGKGGGGGEKKNTLLFSLPAPYPAPFDSPHFLLSSGSFNMAQQIARSKKTPALQATETWILGDKTGRFT